MVVVATPPRGGGGAHMPPISNSMRCRVPAPARTSKGYPFWSQEQPCQTYPCPLHVLHAGALCVSHKVYMGRRWTTLLVLAGCANGRMGCSKSSPPGSCSVAPCGPRASAPASGVGCTSAASCGGKCGECRGWTGAGAPPTGMPGVRGGEPGGARDAVSTRDIAEKPSHIGRAILRSAVGGGNGATGAKTGGKGDWGG